MAQMILDKTMTRNHLGQRQPIGCHVWLQYDSRMLLRSNRACGWTLNDTASIIIYQWYGGVYLDDTKMQSIYFNLNIVALLSKSNAPV